MSSPREPPPRPPLYRYATGDAAPTPVLIADGVASLLVDASNVY
jgi:hypothetical protein